MNIIAKHEDRLFLAVGDIHGDFSLLKGKIKSYNIEDAIMFVAGDFGVGFCYNNPRKIIKEKKFFEIFNHFLKKRNLFIYVVRGNHDNPCFFDGQHNFSNLIFMKDYDVVEIGKHKILGIGGAISVDRKPNRNFQNMYGKHYKGRIKGKDWWPNEKFVYDEKNMENFVGIDVVVTHTAPDFVFPNILNEYMLKWIEYDPELKTELFEERKNVSKIYEKLKDLNCIKYWYYAHFHKSNCEKYQLTEFKLLDVGEIIEVRT